MARLALPHRRRGEIAFEAVADSHLHPHHPQVPYRKKRISRVI